MLIVNLFTALYARLYAVVTALAALAGLSVTVATCLFGKGTRRQRIASALARAEVQRRLFSVLRAFLPNIVLGRKLVTAYDNGGSALVTRSADVREVLSRDDDFEVVYSPRMEVITGGDNFFLGMQPSGRYTRDVSNMRLVVRRDDVAERVVPFVAARAAELVAGAPGRIDVPQALSLRVPAQLLGDYFGLPGPSEEKMIEWTTILFWYLFADLTAEPEVTARSTAAAAEFRAYLDDAIAARRRQQVARDDILGRCLLMDGVTPGMDDLGIRNNLIGLMIGAVPTTSKSAVQALDQLLDRPRALVAAQAAARSDDDALLARIVFEALRFNPGNPVIYRRAVRDTVIARNTLRSRKIPKSTMVFAANFSAMFDPLHLPMPHAFRTDRPWEHYMLWGYGLHTCFGDYINRAMIPGLLKPLLKKNGLRRANGSAGRIDAGGTPFPVHFVVEYDRG
ncbi:MAG TPA: cytochrome P450 [Geobacteraceae bacterium]